MSRGRNREPGDKRSVPRLHSSQKPALKLCVSLKTKRSPRQIQVWPFLYPQPRP